MWLDRGKALWIDGSSGPSCQSCHGPVESLQMAAPSFPRLGPDGKNLINLDDQIAACRTRTGRTAIRVEDDEGLALSALLHETARGQTIAIQAPPGQMEAWQAHLTRGTQLFSTRIGRINLACVNCHEQNVGKQMRADVISPANPTGFPIYRMSWQRLGSIERRLRACYSGVQAELPAPGDPVLRELELYLKVRANGMPLDGPSIRR
jgi:sulfur-oxidizing protein SoxA